MRAFTVGIISNCKHWLPGELILRRHFISKLDWDGGEVNRKGGDVAHIFGVRHIVKSFVQFG